jgi:PTH1 family peptidyl-tRNA hydrolase
MLSRKRTAMKVVVGLGNPGTKYHGTRHNVGYAVIDSLAAASGVGRFQDRFQAEIGEWLIGDEKVLLVKPTTFMNLSGRAVRQILDFYQLPADQLLVVCDDVNLPLGKLRFRAKGTHGGHNGLRDIQNHLGTTAYPRLRIGVDAPGQEDMVDHVLSRFKAGQRKVIEDAVSTAAQGVELWVRNGIQECMNKYNGEPGTN